MAPTPSKRLVYSSGQGRMCPGCGWPQEDCRCSKNLPAPDEAVPERVTVKLRVENRGPGKHVTVLDGLPRNGPYLEQLCRNLKKACGTGGAAGDDTIELQGDQRERLRELLAKKGLQVKG
jgi:translation initiation factor 1